jgi:streptogramin lyase
MREDAMRNRGFTSRSLTIGTALALLLFARAAAADALLTGTVTGAAGEPLGGATVSAKAVGQSITTSVFTDAAGRYYFPTLPAGKYRVWAQALGFGIGRAELEASATRHQDFSLAATADLARQLPGDLLLAALPAATPDDQRLKRLVRNNCTGCHTPSYILQHRFDAAGWSAIIELMKRVNVSGIYQGADAKPNGILDFHQQELAAYLARARGPGASTMVIKLPPRPAGEAARVVVTEYDVPVDRELGLPKPLINDGSDWSLGTPSRSGSIVHDAWADLDGNLWYTANTPNHSTTIGKIDTRSGAVTPIKVAGANGLAANAHGMVRDPQGIIWFNVNPGRGGLGRLDPKTQKIEIFIPPETMSPTGGATTVDYDGKGKIWVSAPDGVLRFDPDTKNFTSYKSPSFKTDRGTGLTYGAAGDRDGNGWWAQMAFDVIGKADGATGRSSAITLPPIEAEMNRVTADERALYASFGGLDFNTPFPWSQGPRRMGTDKQADTLWVGDSWGGNLARIDTHSNAVGFVPLPDPDSQQPYHVAVDRNHNVWTNMWTSDVVMRYDPAQATWTRFELPTRGSEARYVSLAERDGALEVVLPYSRASKVAVMRFRSEQDLQAARSKVASQ